MTIDVVDLINFLVSAYVTEIPFKTEVPLQWPIFNFEH